MCRGAGLPVPAGKLDRIAPADLLQLADQAEPAAEAGRVASDGFRLQIAPEHEVAQDPRGIQVGVPIEASRQDVVERGEHVLRLVDGIAKHDHGLVVIERLEADGTVHRHHDVGKVEQAGIGQGGAVVTPDDAVRPGMQRPAGKRVRIERALAELRGRMRLDDRHVAGFGQLGNDIENDVAHRVVGREPQQVRVVEKLQRQERRLLVHPARIELAGQGLELLGIARGSDALRKAEQRLMARHRLVVDDPAQVLDGQFRHDAGAIGPIGIHDDRVEEGRSGAAELHRHAGDRAFLEEAGDRTVLAPMDDDLEGEDVPDPPQQVQLPFADLALARHQFEPDRQALGLPGQFLILAEERFLVAGGMDQAVVVR